MDLMECRKRLDEIDQEIVRLFEERMSVCKQVAEDKIRSGKAVYDGEREKQKLFRRSPLKCRGSIRITAEKLQNRSS